MTTYAVVLNKPDGGSIPVGKVDADDEVRALKKSISSYRSFFNKLELQGYTLTAGNTTLNLKTLLNKN